MLTDSDPFRIRASPKRLALNAGTALSKKIQIWAPFPDLDLSTRQSTEREEQTLLIASTSLLQSEEVPGIPSPW